MYGVFFTNICGSQLYSCKKSRVIIFQMKTLTLVRCQRLSQHNFYQRQLFLSLTPGERMSDYEVVPLSNLLHLHSLQASSRKHFRDQPILYWNLAFAFFFQLVLFACECSCHLVIQSICKELQLTISLRNICLTPWYCRCKCSRCKMPLWIVSLSFRSARRSCASKCPFLCFLRKIVCKIPTPTIDKAASKTCLKKKGRSSVAGNTLSRLDLIQTQQWGKAFFQQWRFLPNLLASRLALAKLDLPDWQTLANSSLVMKGQVGDR